MQEAKTQRVMAVLNDVSCLSSSTFNTLNDIFNCGLVIRTKRLQYDYDMTRSRPLSLWTVHSAFSRVMMRF